MNQEPERKAVWTSLEIAKLAVPIFASIILALVGLQISKEVATFKSVVDRNDKMIDSLVQKRLKLYDEIGKNLNGMFAYYMYVGKWKEFSPEDIVKKKRELDEIIFTYQPFFSQQFIGIYLQLEDQMFKKFGGWGQDAKLRTEVLHRKDFYLPPDGKVWDSKWNDRFVGEDNTPAIRKTYSELISALPRELGIPELSKQGVRSIPIDQVARSNVPKN
ncbi:MAG: hypothetical protein ABIL01_34185 [Pseudomonadota bacterium]